MSETDSALFLKIRRTVIRWFKKHGRDFPWRSSSDPYQILVAEMMLRRTTAVAVSRIYPKFVKKYPGISFLSKSDLKDIQESVRSLGLQSQRAHHLKDMAIYISETYNGDASAVRDDLLSLLGVGRYIAAAVRNFAFGLSETMVDSNIVHFLMRVLGISLFGPQDERAWNIMRDIGGRIQDKCLYWGIIDIVALFCLRKNPRCSNCPMVIVCSFSSHLII